MVEWQEWRYGGKNGRIAEWQKWLHTYIYGTHTHTDDDDDDNDDDDDDDVEDNNVDTLIFYSIDYYVVNELKMQILYRCFCMLLQ